MTRSDHEELESRAKCQREYRARKRLSRGTSTITEEERKVNRESMRKKRDNVEFRKRERSKQWYKRRLDRMEQKAKYEEEKRQLEQKQDKERQYELACVKYLEEREKERNAAPVVDRRIRERRKWMLREISFRTLEMEDLIRRGIYKLKDVQNSQEYATIVSCCKELSEKATYWG